MKQLDLMLDFTSEEANLLDMAAKAGMREIDASFVKDMLMERARLSVHRYADNVLQNHRMHEASKAKLSLAQRQRLRAISDGAA